MAGRVRGGAPRYTAGLGDGHVDLVDQKKVPGDQVSDALLAQQKLLLQTRSNNKHVHEAIEARGTKWLNRYQGRVEELLQGKEADRRFGSTLLDNEKKIDTSRLMQRKQIEQSIYRSRHQSSPTLWEAPVVFFAAAVCIILVFTVFVNLITAGTNVGTRKGKHHGRALKKKHSRVEKMKTDEWNDDAQEDGLFSERGGRGSSADVAVDASGAVYYPYQPRIQQHRHRKNSSSSAIGSVVVSHPNPQTVVSQRSYYLNQAGSAIIAGSNHHSPEGLQASTNNHTVGSSQSPSVSPNPYSAIIDKGFPQPSQLQHQQPAVFPSTPGNARHLSTTASSFESLTRNSGEGLVDEEKAMIRLDEKRSPGHQSPQTTSIRQHNFTVLGSPKPSRWSDQEVDVTTKIRHGQTRVEINDRTPRITNGRQIIQTSLMQPSVPEHSPLQVGELQHNFSSRKDIDLTFASPPRMRYRHQERPEPIVEYPTIPFVPYLEAKVTNSQPPRSINVDDLHLYHLMESGNVSHWEERIAEESRQLEKNVLTLDDRAIDSFKTTIMASETTCTENSIHAADPPQGLVHKRADLTASSDSASSLQGFIDFDELHLVEVIGGGGFGQVWKAKWNETPVAVKVLTGSAQSRNVPRTVLEEFVAEIRLLKGMRHPNICLYMGACLDPPNRAIIMELAANGSLWDALRLPLAPPFTPCDGLTRDGWPTSLYQPDSKHGIPPSTAKPIALSSVPPKGTWHWLLVKRVALGAARGMCYLHAGKPPILHRDLKSANILLDDSYKAKICDFGLSRLRDHDRSMTGNVGTVQWMPPEVLANQSYNEKADVYSYGIICWELLSRSCPFDKMTPIQCALAVLNRNHRPEIPKWCPPGLQVLIRSCVKRDPDERPDFVEIIIALDQMA